MNEWCKYSMQLVLIQEVYVNESAYMIMRKLSSRLDISNRQPNKIIA